jgi:hypothetical protein
MERGARVLGFATGRTGKEGTSLREAIEACAGKCMNCVVNRAGCPTRAPEAMKSRRVFANQRNHLWSIDLLDTAKWRPLNPLLYEAIASEFPNFTIMSIIDEGTRKRWVRCIDGTTSNAVMMALQKCGGRLTCEA